MADLTADQLADFRGDIGDQTSPYCFSDLELERFYDRAGGDYDFAIVFALWQLLASSAKFYDYTAGYTRQEQEKIYDHLFKLYEEAKNTLRGKQQLQMVGLTIIPPHLKDVPAPSDNYQRIESLSDEQS